MQVQPPFTGNCYVFDLDGTLFDCSHRLHHIQKEPKDWDAYFAACAGDTPIWPMVKLACDLKVRGRDVLYLTGRSDICRQATVDSICTAGLPSGNLFMRFAGDHRNDDILKVEMVRNIRDNLGFFPICIFEDRKRVVDAMRAAGFCCVQVADGDF